MNKLCKCEKGRIISVFLVFIFLSACGGGSSTQTQEEITGAELIFNSGFEPGSTENGASSDISGIDNSVSPPNDWVNDLETHPNIGTYSIQYEGGDDTMRIAEIIEGPTDPLNNVLHYWLEDPNVGGTKGRIQSNIYGNNNLTEFYQRVRLYLHNDWNILQNSPGTFQWLTLFEFWNNAGFTEEGYPFRININAEKRDGTVGSPLYFGINAETKIGSVWGNLVWSEDNISAPISINQWLTIEIYMKEGDGGSGRFYLAVTPDGGTKEVIFDITNFTHHPDDPNPDGISHFNPMKLYTSNTLVDYVRTNGGVLQVYWDDFELWKGTGLVELNNL